MTSRIDNFRRILTIIKHFDSNFDSEEKESEKDIYISPKKEIDNKHPTMSQNYEYLNID